MSIYNSSNALSSIKREAYSHCVFVCTAHYRMKLASALTVNECERVRARAASEQATERVKEKRHKQIRISLVCSLYTSSATALLKRV